MKLIVDIPEEIYNRFIMGFANEDDSPIIEKLFQNGTPLPDDCELMVKKKTDRKTTFPDLTVTNKCRNLAESYGALCVCCNKCGRFNEVKFMK